MSETQIREKIEAAKAALFALEEALGPPDTEARREIYAVRVKLGFVSAHIMSRMDNDDT